MSAESNENQTALIVLTDEQRDEVRVLAPYLTQELIADHLGISRSTFKRILKRDDETLALYKNARASVIAKISQTLIGKAIKGDMTAMIFFLKTQAGWRETNRTEHVLPGAASDALDSDPKVMTKEDLTQTLREVFGHDHDDIPDFDEEAEIISDESEG